MAIKEPWNRITLDAWAILAWLQGKPSGKMVKDLMDWAEGNPEAAPESPDLCQS